MSNRFVPQLPPDPVHPAILWTGFVGPIVIWGIYLTAGYALAGVDCSQALLPASILGLDGALVTLGIVTAVTAVLIAAIGIACLRGWWRVRGARGREFDPAPRAAFMAAWGATLSATVLLGLLWTFVPLSMITGCR